LKLGVTLQNAPSAEETLRRWHDAGFEELVSYYPPDTAMPVGSVAPGVFERAYTKG
jgi:hypothetical protein